MDRVFIEGKVADLGLYVADPSIDHVFIEVIEGRVAELGVVGCGFNSFIY